MNTPYSRGMTRATELTRSGKLDEATSLIQSLLLASPAHSGHTSGADVIKGNFTRLGNTTPMAIPRAAGASARAARKGLGETLRMINAGGMPKRGVLAPKPIELPEGAQFLLLTHSGVDSRDYRLYVPANQPEGPMPLVVMLHGCTQSPEDFAFGTGMNALAEEFGCLVAWPAQPQGANVQKCWNWFRPEDQEKGRGEPALIAGIVRDILRDHPADAGRVYVAGL